MSAVRGFNPETRTYLLPITPDQLQVEPTVMIDDKEFTAKAEFHVTVVGFPLGRKIKKAIEEDPEVEDRLNDLVARYPLQVTLGFKKYLIAKEKPNGYAESIIELVDVHGIDQFIGELSEIIGEEIDVPPMHVTTHTYLDPMGIGLKSQQEFDECRQREL